MRLIYDLRGEGEVPPCRVIVRRHVLRDQYGPARECVARARAAAARPGQKLTAPPEVQRPRVSGRRPGAGPTRQRAAPAVACLGGRFRELVAPESVHVRPIRLRRGLSASPAWRDPARPARPRCDGIGCPDVLSRAWGSCLLVKTGPIAKVRQEWEAVPGLPGRPPSSVSWP